MVSEQRRWRIGIDIGGTFTDVVALHEATGEMRTGKVPSRPGNPTAAIEEGIAAVGVVADAVAALVLGTTRVTNAIVEGNLPPVALLATEGFEDTIEIGRLSRAELYNLARPPKPVPLVRADRPFGVPERLAHQANVVPPLEPAATAEAVERAVASGAASVAVSLLHSYADGSHERQLGDALRARGLHVSLSHRINPEAREYERTAVTVLNAAITPIAVDYLAVLEEHLALGSRLRLFHSAGGMATAEAVRERPLVMAMSGPAAGVAASANLARSLGIDRMLTFDMGGTTTDVCLIRQGRAEIADNRRIAERPLRMPMVAVDSIGAGGGSIVRAGAGGISTGPDSAGAEPGPACYGMGGTEPTITDVNLVLGYLDAGRTLGGRIRLDPDLARASLAPLAGRLGIPVTDFALGTVKIANATMARALRRVTVERGIDGRTCTLVAYGGAAPMHACGLADTYGIRRIVVPRASSMFSALGCVTADTAYTHQRTVRQKSNDWQADRFEAMLDDNAATVLAPIRADSADPAAARVEHLALVRYVGQSSLVEVPVGRPHDLAAMGATFRERHDALYGFATDEDFEVESLRSTAVLPSDVATTRLPEAAGGRPRPLSHGTCWFENAGAVETPRYDRADLVPGHAVAGPAVIEDEHSTTVLAPGWTLGVDGFGHLLLEKDAP